MNILEKYLSTEIQRRKIDNEKRHCRRAMLETLEVIIKMFSIIFVLKMTRYKT